MAKQESTGLRNAVHPTSEVLASYDRRGAPDRLAERLAGVAAILHSIREFEKEAPCVPLVIPSDGLTEDFDFHSLEQKFRRASRGRLDHLASDDFGRGLLEGLIYYVGCCAMAGVPTLGESVAETALRDLWRIQRPDQDGRPGTQEGAGGQP